MSNQDKIKLTRMALLIGCASLGSSFLLQDCSLSKNQEIAKMEAESQQYIRDVDFQLYAPKSVVDGLRFDSVMPYRSDLHPPIVQLNFDGTFNMLESKRTAEFNPPSDCGPFEPDSRDGYPEWKDPGRLIAKTSKGYEIYVSHSVSSNSDQYYVPIDNTLLRFSASTVYRDAPKRDSLIKLVNTMEKVSPEELLALGRQASQFRDQIEKHPDQYVRFVPFLPKYVPFGYKSLGADFSNPLDVTNPFMTLKYRLSFPSSPYPVDLTIYEFVADKGFNPPDSCGCQSPEVDGGIYCPGTEIGTTNDGIKVWAEGTKAEGDYLKKFRRPVNNSPAYLKIGQTKITIDHQFGGDAKKRQEQLMKVINSLEKTTPSGVVRFDQWTSH